MTLTTTPNSLTDAMEKLMKPLRIFKVPVHEVAMMMSIALRFIPILLEETDKIMKAQIARGADFESGNLMKKAKSLVPLLVPLFIYLCCPVGIMAQTFTDDGKRNVHISGDTGPRMPGYIRGQGNGTF